MCVYLVLQLNATYIDGQIAWLQSNLASSTADYNIVVVRACMQDTWATKLPKHADHAKLPWKLAPGMCSLASMSPEVQQSSG